MRKKPKVQEKPIDQTRKILEERLSTLKADHLQGIQQIKQKEAEIERLKTQVARLAGAIILAEEVLKEAKGNDNSPNQTQVC